MGKDGQMMGCLIEKKMGEGAVMGMWGEKCFFFFFILLIIKLMIIIIIVVIIKIETILIEIIKKKLS